MRFRHRPTEEVELNLTPLIDVVFLLLIFFMVSTTFERESQLSIELPQAAQEQPPEQGITLQLSINAAGDYFINGKAVGNSKPHTLYNALQQTSMALQQPKVIINADRATPHQAVMTALDVLSRLQLTQILFATTQSGES
ncbi:biopolymer transporter ExbD [Ectothiorhodospiraceae bacterium BW-2]|nr:biopolymer transporter ExbD [Ectothiorhodospiraceae bacterium BW-2]